MRNCLHCIRYCMALLLLVLWSFFFKISSATKKTGFSTVVVVVRAECQHVTSHQKAGGKWHGSLTCDRSVRGFRLHSREEEEEKMHAGNSARGAGCVWLGSDPIPTATRNRWTPHRRHARKDSVFQPVNGCADGTYERKFSTDAHHHHWLRKGWRHC